jgi:hypothetical protein
MAKSIFNKIEDAIDENPTIAKIGNSINQTVKGGSFSIYGLLRKHELIGRYRFVLVQGTRFRRFAFAYLTFESGPFQGASHH